MTRHPARFHGFLVIDKPAGWTSHDVVARVRKLSRQRAVGHAGTLDPAATGVLPVALGDATKMLRFLDDSRKTYIGEVTFGVATDSLDIDGTVVEQSDIPNLDRSQIDRTLDRFRGSYVQEVPRFSAVKTQGRKLYQRARAGEEFQPPSREITIHRLDILKWLAPDLTIEVESSKGTYIRSLARDIGEALDTTAYLSNLVRTRTGPFDLADAWRLRELAWIDFETQWPSISIHPDHVMSSFDVVVLDHHGGEDWRHGRRVPRSGEQNTQFIGVYSRSGVWLGYGSQNDLSEDLEIQPSKVILAPDSSGEWNTTR